MKFISLALLVLGGIATTLAMLNLQVLMQRIEFDLWFTTVPVATGLVLLVWMGLSALVFLGFAIYVQTTALLESRRQAREMQTMRTLTDKAEASRITELQAFIEEKFLAQKAALSETKAELLKLLKESEARQLAFAEQSSNTLSAYIGELEGIMKSRP